MNVYITIYLIIGVLFNLFLDLATDTIVKHGIDDEENIRLPMGQKILVGIVWPIALIVLISKFFKSHD